MHAPRTSLVLIVFLSLCLNGLAQTKGTQKTLQAAIAAGEVRAEFTSNGTSSGDSIILTVSKTEKAPAGLVILSLSAGLRLTNASETEQSMVLASIRGRLAGENSLIRESTIRLETQEPVKYVLSAYCADFSKADPSSKSKFNLGATDPNISCVLRDAGKHGLSVRATQAAVWIQTDHVGVDTVNHKFQVTSADWSLATEVASGCNSTLGKAKTKEGTFSLSSSEERTKYTQPKTPPTPSSNESKPASSITNADVIEMTKAGISEGAIVLAVQNSATAFDTSPAALIALRKQHVPNGVLEAMLRRQTDRTQVSPEGNRSANAVGTVAIGGLVGVQVSGLSPAIRRGAPSATGVYVVKLDDTSPAKLSGLSADDVIQSVILADDPNAPSPQNSSEFKKLAARCVPDCLIAISRAALNYSSVRYIAVGAVGTNFIPEYESSGKVCAYRNAKVTGYPLSSPYPMDMSLQPTQQEMVANVSSARTGATLPQAMAFSSTTGMPMRGAGSMMLPGAMPTPVMAAAPTVNAPRVQMTQEEIDSAIAKGTQNAGHRQGVVLVDVGNQTMQGIMVGLLAAGAKPTVATQIPDSGFEVWLLTPRDWIAQQASEAATGGRTFTRRDVTDDMLRAVLRVRAYPSTPGPSPSAIPTVNSKTSLSPVGSPTGSALSSQGTPVVDLFLTDKSSQHRLEPIAREAFKYQNLQGQMAQFLLSDV